MYQTLRVRVRVRVRVGDRVGVGDRVRGLITRCLAAATELNPTPTSSLLDVFNLIDAQRQRVGLRV